MNKPASQNTTCVWSLIKGTNRKRALAAARVYGRKLREPALAAAIFQTGETKASDAGSVRASLGVLVRHGQEWERQKGWLYYRGENLEPDRDTIRRLNGEREERKRESQISGGTAQN